MSSNTRPCAFTTKAAEWCSPPLKIWTTRPNARGGASDGFNIEFATKEEVPLRIIADLGHGRFGRVDKMECKETKMIVAVKQMNIGHEKESIHNVQNEVTSLRRLSHYHITQALGSFTYDGTFGFLLLPVGHASLQAYLRNAMDPEHKLLQNCGPRDKLLPTLFGCLANGLRYIHQSNVKHKDIKPSNLILDGSRVLIADFGLSRIFESQSVSYGPSSMTPKYASPEITLGDDRHRSTDIFSLGCVFAEAFTVLREHPIDEIFDRLSSKEGPYYYANIPSVLRWLRSIATMERCDVQIIHLITGMLHEAPEVRPDAEEVWNCMTNCTSNSKTYYCGPCCMPVLKSDSLLEHCTGVGPEMTTHATSMQRVDDFIFANGTSFTPRRPEHKQLAFEWIRNLRHGSFSILDVVRCVEIPSPMSRKRIISQSHNRTAVERAARNEAETMRALVHHHIVKLVGTYQQTDVFGLLFQPAADYDLRTYLGLIEMLNTTGDSKDVRFLAESFGCLANAMRFIHGAKYSHGDIKAENILVHADRVFFAKFAHATSAVRNDSRDYILDGDDPSDMYRSPKFTRMEQGGEQTSDIFSLGCVFLEMYTALNQRTIGDLTSFRAGTKAKLAYRHSLSEVSQWYNSLNPTDEESPAVDVLRSMVKSHPFQRPNAIQIHEVMKTSTTKNGLRFCGTFCRQS